MNSEDRSSSMDHAENPFEAPESGRSFAVDVDVDREECEKTRLAWLHRERDVKAVAVVSMLPGLWIVFMAVVTIGSRFYRYGSSSNMTVYVWDAIGGVFGGLLIFFAWAVYTLKRYGRVCLTAMLIFFVFLFFFIIGNSPNKISTTAALFCIIPITLFVHLWLPDTFRVFEPDYRSVVVKGTPHIKAGYSRVYNVVLIVGLIATLKINFG